jgi:hypothetical protein
MQHNIKSLIWKPKPYMPLDSNIMNVVLNNRCQVHLKPLKKTNSDAKIYYRFFSSNFPHSWPCFFHYAQPKDTPLRFLAPTLVIVLQHKFKVLQQKFPPSHMHLDFYMSISSTTWTPSFFIIPQHQPLISILILNHTIILLSHWRSKIHQRLAQ